MATVPPTARLADLVRSEIATLSRTDDVLREAIAALRAVGPIAVIGGFVRNTVLGIDPIRSKDIDLVIDGDFRDFVMALTPWEPTLNRFGGFRIEREIMSIDTWCLRETWALRGQDRTSPRFEDLLDIVPFDRDGVIVPLDDGKSAIVHPDWWSAMESGTIELVSMQVPDPARLIGRARRLVSGGLAPGPKLAALL
jgi:hypothetical protein